MIAIDTETVALTEDQPVPRLVSVSITTAEGNELLHRTEALPRLQQLLGHTLYFANAPFDVRVLSRAYPTLYPALLEAYEQGRVRDVITNEKIISGATGAGWRKFGLGPTAERHGLTVDKSDEWRTRYGELEYVPIRDWPEGARYYAMNDSWATYFIAQQQEHEHADRLGTAPITARAHLALYQHFVTGLYTDPVYVAKLGVALRSKQAEQAVGLLDAGLLRPNGTRNEKLARQMVEQVAPPEHRRTKKGPAIGGADLRMLDLPADSPLFAYQKWGSIQTLCSKNLEPMQHRVVRTRYDEHKVTGRTGSADPGAPFVGTNLQNLPRNLRDQLGSKELQIALYGEELGFRECIVPPADHLLIACDYNTFELIGLACIQFELFGTSALGDALRAGRDPHTELAAQISAGTDRTLAKAANFGYPGGLGAEKFQAWAFAQYDLVLNIEQCRRLKYYWQKQWPEMKRYHAYISALPRDDRGYRIYRDPVTGFVRAGMTFTEAANCPFQSRTAFAAKAALWAMYRAYTGELAGSWGILFAHDEIVSCVPEDRAQDYARRIERIMCEAAQPYLPHLPVRAEAKIMRRYSK